MCVVDVNVCACMWMCVRVLSDSLLRPKSCDMRVGMQLAAVEAALVAALEEEGRMREQLQEERR